MRRPLCILAVVLVLGIYIYYSGKGAGAAHRAALHPSFLQELEAAEKGVVERELTGRLLWIETGPEKDVFLVDCGRECGNVRISVDKKLSTKVRVGMVVKVQAKCFLYEKATNPGQFDLRAYYERLGFYFGAYDCEIISLSSTYRKIPELLRSLSLKMEKVMDEHLSKEDASKLKSLLLGNDNFLEEELKEDYRRAGLQRLLKMTGFHITLIGLSIYQYMKKRSRLKLLNIMVTLLCVFPFIFFSAFRVSVIRAWILLAVRITADLLKRKFDLLSGGALAFLLLLFRQPLLIFDSAFQYYGGILFSTGVVSASVNAWLKRYHPVFTPLIYLLSVQAVFIPINLYYDFSFSIYGPLVQFLVVLISGLQLLTGFIGTLTGMISGAFFKVSDFFYGTCHYLNGFLNGLTEKMKNLPGTNIIHGRPSSWKTFLYIGLFIGLVVILQVLFEKRKRIPEKEERKIRNRDYLFFCGVLMLFLLFGMLFLKAPEPGKNELQILMMDVGQGDGFLLRTGKRNVLIDCGSSSEDAVGKDVLIPVLKFYGISKLDLVIISHPDTDHTNGILEIIQNGPVKIECFCYSEIDKFREAAIIKSVEEKEIPIKPLQKGDEIHISNLDLKILWPESWRNLQGNDGSLVIEAAYFDFKAFFTGDLGGEYEEFLDIWDIDLLKTAHHGSYYSTTDAFLKRTKPEIAWISCGLHNPYGHPSEETLKRLEKNGADVFRTDLLGAVLLRAFEDGRIELRMLAN